MQTKLTVGAAGDAYELEADRVADQVLARPAPATLGSAPLRLMRVPDRSNGQANVAPESVEHVLAGAGRPLEPGLRQDMEAGFGHDFSRVRVHTDTAAAQSARGLGAHAYTVGHDIAFGPGRFVPGTQEGRRLVAHELAHVVQQRAATVLQRQPAKPGESGSGAVQISYPEEEDILRYALKVLPSRRLAPGVVFFNAQYQKAIGVSEKSFVVGPFSSDMGPFWYVYRLKSQDSERGTATFLRGAYSGGWGRGNIPDELYPMLAKIEGREEVKVASPPPRNTDPQSRLPFMLTVWQARGQLDPQVAGNLPQLEVTQAQGQQLKQDLSGPTAAAMFGGVQVLPSGAATQTAIATQTGLGGTGAGATGTTFARGTGQFTAVSEEVAGEAAAGTGTGTAARLFTAGRLATAAAVVIILWESNDVRPWMTGMSEITGEPFSGPGQLDWESRLTPRQRDVLKDLWRYRYDPPGSVHIEELKPTPTKKVEPTPTPTPTTQTEPDTQRRRRRKKCPTLPGSCPAWRPRLTSPNRYWDLAYSYRRDHNMLKRSAFNQNVAVLVLDGEDPIIRVNSMGFHSEQNIMWTLNASYKGDDCPIRGLFSDRKPCQTICQSGVLPQLCLRNQRVPFDVFFATDYYNAPDGEKSENNRHELIKSYATAGYSLKD